VLGGIRLGPYELLDVIGRGGASVVHRARGDDGRIVALKLLTRRSSDAAARFEREARLHAALGEEEGFVPLLASGESPQGPYIVMPFLPGGTLRDRLRRGHFEPKRAVELIRSLAAAMGRAHALGIVHRDLKPENVLFTDRGAESGGDGRALVADLGLAKHFASPGAESLALSRTEGGRGTVGYMAPEQVDRARDAKPASDVFSLGAILYECLTGEPAFAGASETEVLVALVESDVRPFREVAPHVPSWLEAVVRRALAKAPEKRFADAAALEAALAAGPPRSRARPIVAAVALALLAAGTAVAARGFLASPVPERDPLAEARRDFEAARDEAGWLAAARALERAGRSVPLAADDERRRVVALALGGRPDLPALAREAAQPGQDVLRAVATVYEEALAQPAPVASLRALDHLRPPPAFGKRLGAVWLEESERQADTPAIASAVFGLSTNIGAESARLETIEELVARIGRALDAFGRALAADPGMDPWPRKLGPFFTIVRLLHVQIDLAQDARLVPAWRHAAEPVRDHPLGLVLLLEIDRKSGVPPRQLADRALAALDGLERVRDRTTHVRAFARELMRLVFEDRGRAEGQLDDLDRCARLADFAESWHDVAETHARAGRPDDEAVRHAKAASPIPRGLWEIYAFNAEDEDPR
jgi:tetratricopeptide (TPR) repeat protein